MSESENHPSIAVLRKLSVLSNLSDAQLGELSEQVVVQTAEKGDVLLLLKSTDETLIYLLEGDCKMIAADGGIKNVNHRDPSAKSPLARLRPSRYRIEAASDVRYLVLDANVADTAEKDSSRAALETYEVADQADDSGDENQLTLRLYEDLNSGHLLLPSLPRVAARIGEAVNDEDSDARKVASLIETDPAIAIKIIKAANSARFGGAADVGTVAEAVTRLGLQNTRTLVITFALREVFRTSSEILKNRMKTLWKHSRRIAALCQVLSKKIGGFNSHEALLAGLIHDIGVLAVIGYARDFPDVAAHPQALEASIHSLRAHLGGMILKEWNMSKELIVTAQDAENWSRKGDEAPDFADLVIVAQFHEGIAGSVKPSDIPSIRRLGLTVEQDGTGIDLLRNADTEVAAADRALSA